MTNTELSIDISGVLNPKVLIVYDASEYSKAESITNYLLEVLPPGKNIWSTFFVDKDFRLILNSSNLDYTKGSLISLPDGIYEFKQSYKPNIHTVAHFLHLRTTTARQKYLDLLSKHFTEECKRDKRAFAEETEKLNTIRNYIEAAEYVVSDIHDKEKGIKYYNYILELLKRFDNACSCR